jgi:uncharacterized protein
MKTTIRYMWPGMFFLWATYQLAEAFMHFQNDLFAFMLLMGCVPVVAHLVARRQGLDGVSSYGLAWNKNTKRLFTTGMLSGMVVYTLSFLVSIATGRETPGGNVSLNVSTIGKILLCFAGTFLPTLAEDIVTRGYLYRVFGKKWNKATFVIVSALVYVLNHTYKLAAPDESLLYLFITGIALAIPLALTQSLWYTVGLHWACNIVYRISEDVLHSSQTTGDSLSSLRILMIVVLLSIPFNIYVLKRIRYQSMIC